MTSQAARLILTFILLFEGSKASGQNISFLRSKNIPIAAPPFGGFYLTRYNFAPGDFNGDGKLDLVVSSPSNTVLLLGVGDGSFEKAIDLGFVADVVIAADFNGDKKVDLVFGIGGVLSSGGQGYLLLGNGDGTFQAARQLPSVPLAVADFNRDGILDLLVAGQIGETCSDSSIHVFPGKGDGTFGNSLPCSMQFGMGDWGTRTIVVGDLNGDGKLDVVWGNARSSSVIAAWLGNGDGTFQPPSGVNAHTNQGGKPIAFGDLNHDGKPDLVAVTYQGIAILFGNGDGTFQTEPLYLSYFDGFNHMGPHSWLTSNDIFIRDFDGDGNQDILLDDTLFRGKGDGTFQPPQYLGVGSSNGISSAVSVICDDFSGDGKPDIIYLPSVAQPQPGSTGSLAVLLNNSPNGLASNALGFSAATGGSLLAPASIASLYGKSLSKSTASSSTTTFPTQLGGISLRVRDDTDTVRLAQLIFVSPTQINFVLPPGTSIGPVTFNIDDGTTPFQEGANATIVNTVAPGFFTANQTGTGTPAATAIRIRTDGTQEPVAVFTCTFTRQCSAAPIDMTSGLPVYLNLYGTGFRNTIPQPNGLQCQVGGKAATVQFAGPHSIYPGLDQLNLLIPQSLPPGQANVQCSFDGSQSNTVSISIK